MFEAHDAILAVDIGGTNIRAGVVQLNLRGASDLSKAKVWKFELWRHGDEKAQREEAVDGLISMLRRLITRAKKRRLKTRTVHRHRLSGQNRCRRLDRSRRAKPAGQLGKQPLQSLPKVLFEAIPRIGDHETAILMQQRCRGSGLSEAPFMKDVGRPWATFTIGHGAGQRVVRQPRAMMSSAAVIARNGSDEAIQD